MKKFMALIFIAFALSGCGKEGTGQPASTESNPAHDLLKDIWNAYTNLPDNAGQGVRWINVEGKMIKQGTVPPSAVNSSADGRLPAYLACYDYVAVWSGLGDSKADMCIYYIDNPTRGTYSIMARGKQYIDQLYSRMADDGFTQN